MVIIIVQCYRSIHIYFFFRIRIVFLDEIDNNMSSEDIQSNNENDELGGLFYRSQQKKININDREDYTFDQQNEKFDWNIDQV